MSLSRIGVDGMFYAADETGRPPGEPVPQCSHAAPACKPRTRSMWAGATTAGRHSAPPPALRVGLFCVLTLGRGLERRLHSYVHPTLW